MEARGTVASIALSISSVIKSRRCPLILLENALYIASIMTCYISVPLKFSVLLANKDKSKSRTRLGRNFCI